MFIREQYENREIWLKERGKGIGASDSSACCGLNPYKTNVQLYQEKKGLISSIVEENESMQYGNLQEENIRNAYKVDMRNYMEIYHKSYEICIRTDKPYIRSSLDGEITMKEDYIFHSYYKSYYNDASSPPEPILLKKGMKGVLEIKTTEVLSSMSKEKWHNKVPMNYYIQNLHQLLTTDYDFAILVAELRWEDVNNVKTKEIRYYGFLKEQKTEDLTYLEKMLDDFWINYYLKDIEPPLKFNL